MTDWIDEKAARSRTLKDDTRKRLSQGRQTIDQLETIVRRDIEKLNARFEQKIDGVSKTMPSGAFNDSARPLFHPPPQMLFCPPILRQSKSKRQSGARWAMASTR